jgi:hypothetical protein
MVVFTQLDVYIRIYVHQGVNVTVMYDIYDLYDKSLVCISAQVSPDLL